MAPRRFRWLVGVAIFMLVITVLAIGLIASGLMDPMPAGTRQWTLQGLQIVVAPQAREINWLREEVPNSAVTIRATGALRGGELDSGYGLVIGDDKSYVAVAVSPVGYLAIWESDQTNGVIQDNYLLQWQTWPHVRGDYEPNEIWVDLNGDRATVRVNREWLWEGEIGPRTRNIGLLGESFAEAATIDFANVELFAGR